MAKQIPLVYGGYYHIYNRGNNRENIFIEERNYAYFLTLYAKYIAPFTDIYAYCLLRNHFHLLVRIRTEEELIVQPNPKGLQDPSGLSPKLLDPSQQFGKLFDAYAKAMNKAYHRTGSLFQHPFGRIRVTRDEYFAQLILYIHFNPQKHGFVEDFREYPYSSYDALLSDKPTKLARARVIEWFSGKPAFLAAHELPVDEKKISSLIEENTD
jgi:REP-associated tyrosine transposase